MCTVLRTLAAHASVVTHSIAISDVVRARALEASREKQGWVVTYLIMVAER